MRLLLALIATVLLSACATNPATGKRQISFMSEEKEIAMGRQLDAQVRQEMGLYENDELQRYVQDLGMQIAQRSERPNLPWSFAIVDSPAVNAFALPGGFIYVTRGILPYLDNEAQLVGVLGHEIGHVTARHSAAQYTRGMGTSLGVLVGSIFVPEIAPFADLAEVGAGMVFMKFGRDDELQADALGAQYTAQGGWDPEQVPAFLTTLARISEASDRNGVPNWLSTHPQPENRVQKVAQTVGKVRTGGPDAAWNIDRDGYLSRIDGMIFGDDPEEGVVRGNLFLHGPMRFSLVFPDGWEITNTAEQVVAQEPGNKVYMLMRTLEPSRARSLEEAAQQHMRGSGYKATNLTRTTIDGLDAVLGTYEGSASGIGKVTSRGAHFVMGRSTYFIGGIAPPDAYARVEGDFEQTIQSFRQLSAAEADAIHPNLIDLYTARAGDTWQSIAQRAGKGLVKASTLAIMNDHSIDDQPKAGERLKIVVAG